jgi:anti-anti-sigma regulatory factor/pSer/pThr/pTyr-binding forkhead associated (FHA) protein
MKLFLIVAKGKHKGMPIPIKIDLYLLGADKMCQLRSDRPGIGNQHCALVTRERKVFVRDLDSGELTLLNGEPVPPGEERPLHAGDHLAVGPLEFLVQFREKPLSQRDLEEWALKCLDVDSTKTVKEFDEDDPFHENRPSINASEAASSILDRLTLRRGLVKGRLRIGLDSGVTTVRFNDLYLVEESEIALVKKEVQDNLIRPNLRVLFDCKNVRRLSSAAAEMFLELHSWLGNRGCSMALCRVRPDLHAILHTLGIFEKVRHFSDKKLALGARWS